MTPRKACSDTVAFPRRERGSNLGPLAPDASGQTTELQCFLLNIPILPELHQHKEPAARVCHLGFQLRDFQRELPFNTF